RDRELRATRSRTVRQGAASVRSRTRRAAGLPRATLEPAMAAQARACGTRIGTRLWLPAAAMLALVQHASADPIATIDRVRSSVVAVGTYERTRSPAFQFRATGFAFGDCAVSSTIGQAVSVSPDREIREIAAILVPGRGREPQMREARAIAVDPDTDLALLRIDGAPLPALKLRTDGEREGQVVL